MRNQLVDAGETEGGGERRSKRLKLQLDLFALYTDIYTTAMFYVNTFSRIESLIF